MDDMSSVNMCGTLWIYQQRIRSFTQWKTNFSMWNMYNQYSMQYQEVSFLEINMFYVLIISFVLENYHS